MACLSPAFGAAVELAACPESTGPGFDGRCPPKAPQGRLVQTAPTNGETTVWMSTPGYQTYTGDQPST